MAAQPEEIAEHIKELEKDQDKIVKYVSEMIIALEGAISYSEAWEMSHNEREALIKAYNKKMKEMKKAMG